MGKRSFFFRNYLSHSLLIVFAFLLAGTLFSYQFGSYVKDESFCGRQPDHRGGPGA